MAAAAPEARSGLDRSPAHGACGEKREGIRPCRDGIRVADRRAPAHPPVLRTPGYSVHPGAPRPGLGTEPACRRDSATGATRAQQWRAPVARVGGAQSGRTPPSRAARVKRALRMPPDRVAFRLKSDEAAPRGHVPGRAALACSQGRTDASRRRSAGTSPRRKRTDGRTEGPRRGPHFGRNAQNRAQRAGTRRNAPRERSS